MHPWWYAAAMFAAYTLFMGAVRWLAGKIGPRLPVAWQPLLTTPTGKTRMGRRVFWVGIGILVIGYAVAILAARYG